MNPVVKNTVIYTVGGMLNPLIGFLLLPVYTTYLAPGEFGIIASLLALVFLCKALFSLSLDRSMVRLYWDYETDGERRVFLSTMTTGIIGLCLFMTGVTVVLQDQAQRILPDIPFHPYYLLALVVVNEQMVLNIVLNYFRIRENARAFVTLTVARVVVRTAAIVFFIAVLKQGAIGYFKAEAIIASVFALVYIAIISRYYVARFNRAAFTDACRFAVPYVPGIAGAWVMHQSDRIFIARYASLSDVGVFSISDRIASVVSIIDLAFKNAYLPYYFKTASDHPHREAVSQLKTFNDAYLQVMMFLAFAIILLSQEVTVIFLDEQYSGASSLISPLVIGFWIASVSSTIFGTAMQQSKKTIADSGFGLAASGVSLVLNYYLIRSMGVPGAVVSRIASALFLIGLAYFYVRKACFHVPIAWRAVLTSAGVYGLSFVVLNMGLSNVDVMLSAGVKCLSIVVIAVAVARWHGVGAVLSGAVRK